MGNELRRCLPSGVIPLLLQAKSRLQAGETARLAFALATGQMAKQGFRAEGVSHGHVEPCRRPFERSRSADGLLRRCRAKDGTAGAAGDMADSPSIPYRLLRHAVVPAASAAVGGSIGVLTGSEGDRRVHGFRQAEAGQRLRAAGNLPGIAPF